MQTLVELLTFRRDNLITPGIFYLNIFVYLAITLLGGNLMDQPFGILYQYGANNKGAILNGEYHRLLAAVFLHGSLFHLLSNLYALVFVGAVLERWNQLGFFYYYLICGIIASIVSVTFKGMGISVGASGAVFGMFGLLYMLTRYNRLNMDPAIQQNIRSSLVFFIVINLFLGFSRPEIDNAAHLGGLISGGAFGFLHVHSPRPLLVKLLAAAVTAGGFVALITLGGLSYSGVEKELENFRAGEERALKLIRLEAFDEKAPGQKEALIEKLTEGIKIWEKGRQGLLGIPDVPSKYRETVDHYLKYSGLRIKQFKAIRKAVQSGKDEDFKRASEIRDELGAFLGMKPGE